MSSDVEQWTRKGGVAETESCLQDLHPGESRPTRPFAASRISGAPVSDFTLGTPHADRGVQRACASGAGEIFPRKSDSPGSEG